MGSANKNLYLIEEPSIGLRAQDVNKLIDMGPEASEEGGTIAAQGKPEIVAKSKTSRTAPFIKQALKDLK